MIIYLDLLLPASSSGTPKSGPGKPIAFLLPCFGWGLHVPCLLPAKRWALTPPFHPYRLIPAVYFCCTSLRVTPTGRYPASCPAKPGLSSSAAFRRMQPRLSVLLNTVLHYTMSDSECQTPVLLSESLGFCFYILLYTVREKACQTLHRIPRNASGTHFSCLYDA